MEQRILLKEYESEFSNNLESSINIGLSNKTRLLPNDNLSDEFSLFEQYNKERDECNRFRILLTVNPVCSNVLFNMKSEIMVNEGGDDCAVLTENGQTFSKAQYSKNAINSKNPIDYLQSIRDTEYSHPENGNFIYHCGVDIFNNHMLRNNGFVHVNKINQEDSTTCEPVYNTIRDYLRDDEGRIIEQEIGTEIAKEGLTTRMHLYQYDTIQSFSNAFSEKCEEKDGWWGFVNPGNIEIPTSSSNTITVNRMMANNKPCEFIDFYPDRTLFSFIPKFNKYRRREEKNWDFCLTYPYKNDYDMFDIVCGGEKQAVRAKIKYMVNSSSLPVLECSSYFKHNLSVGEYITIYYYYPNYEIIPGGEAYVNDIDNLTFVQTKGNKDEIGKVYRTDTLSSNGEVLDGSVEVKRVKSKSFQKKTAKVKIISVGDVNGDGENRLFSIRFSDIQDIYEYLKFFGFFYKKNSSNSECMYYIRKFKKLKTAEGKDIQGDVNKVAFGKNIYGDDIAQVLFTDDVNVEGLVDNNGRPISEIFFTIVKRNKGYNEWYEDNVFNTPDIEYSHCFGKVTSAIDFSGIEDEPFDYNIHYAHNMDKVSLGFGNTAIPGMFSTEYGRTFSAWGDTVLGELPKTLESGITIDFDEFYGDVIEYDVATATETVIGNICHRVNTAQRETWNSRYKCTYEDAIVSDDYDERNGYGRAWSCVTYYLNDISSSKRVKDDNNRELMYGNIYPEGYFYNPHMGIRIREDDDDVTSSAAKYINYTNPIFTTGATYIVVHRDGSEDRYDSYGEASLNTDTGKGDTLVEENPYYKLTIDVPVNYGFYKGDYIGFYNMETTEITWGEISSVSGLNLTLKFDMDGFATISNVSTNHFQPSSSYRVLYAYWSTDNVPLYAKLSIGQRKFVWRKIVPPSEMIQDDEMYNTPFTNGRFYIQKNFNFFMKRQDPDGKYGLSSPLFRKYSQRVSNPLQKYIISGYDPVDLSSIAMTVNNALTTCY